MLPFIVTGLTTGAVYALAGLGLVLTYKTSGVFNFAHGALATVAAYVFYVLHVLHGWSWPLAALVAIAVAGPLMGLVLELLARRIQTVGFALQVAATVGLLLLVQAAVLLIYGTEELRTVPVFLGEDTFELFGTNVQVAQAVTFAFAVAVTAALTLLLRRSRRGAAMRAVVDDPALLDLTGTSPAATRRLAWVIGVTLAAASGVLFAPLLPLDPVQLTLLVVAAFGAAALGAFTSLPLTLAGGLAVGVLASLSTKWFTDGLLAGLPPTMPFWVLFLVLLLFPKRHLVAKAFTVPESRPAWRAPAAAHLTGGAVLLAVLAFVPAFAGTRLTTWTTFVAMAILFLSLSLLVRTSGQVSLAHVAFAAIGACAFSNLAVDAGLPFWPALLGSGLIAVPIGALLAVPAIRLTGLYLALATFGFGILLQGMFYTQDVMFGQSGVGLDMPRPALAAGDEAFYYLVLAFAVLASAAVVWLNRSRLGRLLRGAADSSVALETAGTSVQVTRVLVFVVSAFLAALAGALAGVAQSTVSAEQFQPLTSLIFFTLVMVLPRSSPWDAVLASALWYLVPSYVTGEDVSTWLQLLFGVAAIGYAVVPGRHRVVPRPVRTLVDRLFGSVRLPGLRPGRTPVAGAPPARAELPGGLEVTGLEVRFGGVVAVGGLSLQAPTGRITGLIGPNGAGKTTTFNACTGLLRPTQGTVALGGQDVSRLGPAARARRGLGRTFQRMELFDTLTVRENVALGAEAGLAGANPLAHLADRPADHAAVAAATDEALALCGLEEVAEVPAMALSTGQQRLVELARCLAGPHRLLLLDEPSSGLDRTETARFGEILKEVVQRRGVGILLVEHDMELVLDVCEHLYVLDFGKPVFEGTPAEVVASPVVRAAYLGDAEVENAVGTTTEMEGVA